MARKRRTQEEIGLANIRAKEGRSAEAQEIRRLLLRSYPTALTISQIALAFPLWTPRNLSAWVVFLRRNKCPWLKAEQRDTGRLHPITKKPLIVWHYTLADGQVTSTFLDALSEES